MKRVIPKIEKLMDIKLPPIHQKDNHLKPTDLLPDDMIKITNEIIPNDKLKISGIADLAHRTVKLDLNHGITETSAGPMYLTFLPPFNINFFENCVYLENESRNDIYNIVNVGGEVWVILPKGQQYTIHLLVKAKKDRSAFHVIVRYQNYSINHIFESEEEFQHLSFYIDARQDNFQGIEITNMRTARKNALHFMPWTFYSSTIVTLN